MPYKDKEQKRAYDRERLRRIREKAIEKEVKSGNLNFSLDNDVKPSDTDTLKPEVLGANAFHSDTNIPEPKKKSNQQKLEGEFGNFAE